jgi:hypothetical protein
MPGYGRLSIWMNKMLREIAFMLNLMKEFGMKLKEPLSGNFGG